jgi:8-oxo-dGTP diphosphatase
MLRDDKPDIKYPNHWDLIGGFVEDSETLEEALGRELKEETNYSLAEVSGLSYWKEYTGAETDTYPNKKFVYRGTIVSPEKLQLGDEGQELRFFNYQAVLNVPLASKHKEILQDYISEFFGA